jgi:DNA polymerase I-like protein with 3'-5' exonuclease and polymerase domains
MSGRRRWLPHINSTDWNKRGKAERVAVNGVVQGSAADLVKGAMVQLASQLRQAGLSSHCRLMVQVGWGLSLYYLHFLLVDTVSRAGFCSRPEANTPGTKWGKARWVAVNGSAVDLVKGAMVQLVSELQRDGLSSHCSCNLQVSGAGGLEVVMGLL